MKVTLIVLELENFKNFIFNTYLFYISESNLFKEICFFRIKQKIYEDLKTEKESLERKLKQDSLVSTQCITISQPSQSQSLSVSST